MSSLQLLHETRIREIESKVYFEGNRLYLTTAVVPTAGHSCSDDIPNSPPSAIHNRWYLVFNCARSSRLHPKHFVSCPSLVYKRNVVGSGFVRVFWHEYLFNSSHTPLSLSRMLRYFIFDGSRFFVWTAVGETNRERWQKTYFLSLWFSCHKKCFANSLVIKIYTCRLWSSRVVKLNFEITFFALFFASVFIAFRMDATN